MKRNEMLQTITYAKFLWPRLMVVPTAATELDVMVSVWMDVLGDLDVEQVRSALAAISNREFPPTPGQVRDEALRPLREQLPDWDQFWRWVRGEAARASLYTYEKKPQLTCPWPALAGLVTVEDLSEWARSEVTIHDLEMVQQAHVRRRFEPAVVRALRDGVPVMPAVAAARAKVVPIRGGEPRRLEMGPPTVG